MLVEVSIDNFRFGHTKSDVGASDLMKRDLIGLYLDSHSILYGFLSFVICHLSAINGGFDRLLTNKKVESGLNQYILF